MTAPIDRTMARTLSARMASIEPGRAFSPERLDVLARLAARLAADTTIGALPEVRAFAFSIRRAAIERLRESYAALATGDSLLVARGVVLHFAPANVDTVGLYSWLWAFLTGNASIVRVSSRRTSLAEALDALVEQALADTPDLASANRWVAYDHAEAITAALCETADVRMIWGGDRAVSQIRAVPARLATVDIVFRDRVSVSVLDGEWIASAGDRALDDAACRFTADLVTFHQAACSSPRTIFWVCETDGVRRRWWEAVLRDLDRRGYAPPEGAATRKLAAATLAAARGQVSAVHALAPALTVLTGGKGPVVDHECGWGFIDERADGLSLAGVAETLDSRVQTVSTLGFEAGALRAFAEVAARKGVDRVVPVGAALQFDRYWDGHDLFISLSRRVGMRVSS